MTSVRYRFGSPFSSKRLWFVDTVLWLCPSLPTETLKWFSSLPILMQKSFWWWQCSDRYIISLFFHLHTLPPPSPSLISRTVSVDVKHHVYLLIAHTLSDVEVRSRLLEHTHFCGEGGWHRTRSLVVHCLRQFPAALLVSRLHLPTDRPHFAPQRKARS